MKPNWRRWLLLLLPTGMIAVTAVVYRMSLESPEPPMPAVAVGSPSANTASEPILEPVKREPTPPLARYRALLIQGVESLRQLQSELGAERFSMVLKINRRDLGHVRAGEALMVPSIEAGPLELSPFPTRVQSIERVPKLVLVSQSVQAFAAYELGELIRWGPTSTGRLESPTPNGLLYTNWRSKQRRSTVNSEWILKWYVNLDNARGISFHEYDLPGYPASHACVRLMPDDAEWLYGWVQEWVLTDDERQVREYGTPVVLFGEFDYDADPPWSRLDKDPAAASVPLDQTEREIEPFLDVILARARFEKGARSGGIPPRKGAPEDPSRDGTFPRELTSR